MTTRLHRGQIDRELGRLMRSHDLHVSCKKIAEQLGYPLAEANMDELKGIIAALSAVAGAAPAGSAP